jgi:hypothetical protein
MNPTFPACFAARISSALPTRTTVTTSNVFGAL